MKDIELKLKLFEKLLKMIEDEYTYQILNYEDEDSIDYQKSIRGIKK